MRKVLRVRCQVFDSSIRSASLYHNVLTQDRPRGAPFYLIFHDRQVQVSQTNQQYCHAQGGAES